MYDVYCYYFTITTISAALTMAFRIKGVRLSGVYFQMSKYRLHEGQKTGTEM